MKTVRQIRPHPGGLTRLKSWRQFRGLSQGALAERAGITQGMVSQLENGHSDYTGKVLQQLADALNCVPADIIQRNPIDTETPWSIWETLQAPERRQMIEIMKVLSRAPGE